MVSHLGQAAAAYTARASRSRRPTRLANSLSSLAQVGEDTVSGETFGSNESPKRWIRDSPGTMNELGEVVRPGSPLRLSSTARTGILAGSGRRRTSLIPKNLLYYGLLFFPLLAAIPMILSYLRTLGTAPKTPEIPSSVLGSSEINPELLQFLKENNEHVALLSSKVAELEKMRDINSKTIEVLQSQLSDQLNAYSKLANEVKGLAVQKTQSEAISRSDLEKVVLDFDNAKTDLSLSILEQKSQLQELSSRKFTTGSTENVEKMIDRALYKHLADGTEMVDYALESTGGSVLSVSSTHSGSVGLFGIATRYLLESRKCENMIRPQVAPGQCWPMAGQAGWAVISLSDSVIPTAVTLEHVAPEIAPHFESAPKEFSLSAINGTGESTGASHLGSWKYRKPIPGEIPVIQTFPITNGVQFPVSTVNFTINSNYGGNYTCIYRIRIHGKRQL